MTLAAIAARMSVVPLRPTKPQHNGRPAGYKMVNRGDRGEVYLYGVIGSSFWDDGISAKAFADDLKKLGAVKTIDLRINSEGGDVFDGRTMHTLLVEHSAKVIAHVDGLAASAASFIAMAGDEILMAEGAFMMVHNARMIAMGEADDMRRAADLLDTVNGSIIDTYVSRTKAKRADVKAWMDAETWMTAKEAIENGFADKIVESLKVAASVRDPSRFQHLPAALRPNRAAALSLIEGMRA